MAYSKTEKLCFELAEPVAAEYGCYIYDIEYVKEGSARFLRIFADKNGDEIIIEDILPCHLDIWYYFRYCTWGETEEYCLRWRDLAEMTWHGWMVYTVKE